MPRFRGSGCAIWRVWAAPGLCRPAKPARASRPLHAVALAPMLPASPPGRRRAPNGPAHAPGQTTSWHQPSNVSLPGLADPYRDTDVIDSRAPRFNQATMGVLSLVVVLAGWHWLVGVLALQLVVGLVFGRRFCLPCLAYFELVQPRFGEGPLEDSRPPRAANIVGAVVLSASALAYALGSAVAGAALSLLVAATGFCTGCEAYKLGCRLTGRPFVSCPIPGARVS